MNFPINNALKEYNRIYKETNRIYHDIALRLKLSDSAF
ncbi:MAG: MarR family transcriptional regulator, partial [Dorea sp.]|nr:MarR family transcriptional regulator [Dorea sp.]